MEGKKDVSRPLKVAVFDDDSDIREVIVLMLEEYLGFEVVAFDSNDRIKYQGITDAIKKGEIKVILCDGMTSGRQNLSGLDVVGIVRKLNFNTRVFVCTGMPSKDFLVQCRQAGANAFIVKPFRIEHIEAAFAAKDFYTNYQLQRLGSIFEALPVTVS